MQVTLRLSNSMLKLPITKRSKDHFSLPSDNQEENTFSVSAILVQKGLFRHSRAALSIMKLSRSTLVRLRQMSTDYHKQKGLKSTAGFPPTALITCSFYQ